MPLTSTKQDQEFIKDIMPTDLLQSAIDYIKSNFRPWDIYDKDDMEEWAEDNGYNKNS